MKNYEHVHNADVLDIIIPNTYYNLFAMGILRASLLGNILSRKGIVRVGSGNKKQKNIVRAGYGKEWDF